MQCTKELSITVEEPDMPIDQAIYHPGRNSIFGVRGGYVAEFSATTGARIRIARFAFPCFGDCGICYDSVNDKLIVSMWNDQRPDDFYTYSPTTPRKQGLYKINPATLLVELFANIIGSVNFSQTGLEQGAHDILFYGGFVYCCAPNPVKLNATTFAVVHDNPSYTTGGWNNLAIDATNGWIWGTESGFQLLHQMDIGDFSGGDINGYVTNYTVSTPVNFNYGAISPNPVYNTPVNWVGPFPAGFYSIYFLSGALHSADAGVGIGYFIHADYEVQPQFDAEGYQRWDGSNPVGDRIGVLQTANGTPGFSATVADAEALNQGQVLSFFSATGFATIGLVYTRDLNGLLGVATNSAIQFGLVRVWDYPGANDTVNPFGVCYAPSSNQVYITNRSFNIGVFDVGTLAFLPTPITISDGDAYAYRIRYNPNDGLIYVPTYGGNKVAVINPATNTVVSLKTGFDSPFDVVFTPTKKWAVQHGQRALKEIV